MVASPSRSTLRPQPRHANLDIENSDREETYRFSPISEPICVMFRISSNHRDESEGKQHKNEHKFSGGEPKLRLSIPLDGEEVDDSVPVSG